MLDQSRRTAGRLDVVVASVHSDLRAVRGDDGAHARGGGEPAHRRPRALHRTAGDGRRAARARAGVRRRGGVPRLRAPARGRDQLPTGAAGPPSRLLSRPSSPAACSRSTPTRTPPVSSTGRATGASGLWRPASVERVIKHPHRRRTARLDRSTTASRHDPPRRRLVLQHAPWVETWHSSPAGAHDDPNVAHGMLVGVDEHVVVLGGRFPPGTASARRDRQLGGLRAASGTRRTTWRGATGSSRARALVERIRSGIRHRRGRNALRRASRGGWCGDETSASTVRRSRGSTQP